MDGNPVPSSLPFGFVGSYLVFLTPKSPVLCLYGYRKEIGVPQVKEFRDEETATTLMELARRWQQGEDKVYLAQSYLNLSEQRLHADEMLWQLALQSSFQAASYSQLFTLVESVDAQKHNAAVKHFGNLLAARAALYDRAFSKAEYYLSRSEALESSGVLEIGVFERLVVAASSQLSAGNLKQGLQRLGQAEALLKSELDVSDTPPQLLAEYYDNLGHAQLVSFYRSGSEAELAQGIKYEQRALALALEAGHPRQIISIHSNNAWLLRASRKYNSAIIHFLQALQILEQQPDPIYRLYLYRNLGELFVELGANIQARTFIQASLAQAEENSLYWQAKLHCLMARSLTSSGKFEDAVREADLCYQQAEFVAGLEPGKRRELRAQSLSMLITLNRASSAQVDKLVGLLDKLEQPDVKIRAYLALASHSAKQGDAQKTQHLIDAAVADSDHGASPTLRLNALTEAARHSSKYNQSEFVGPVIELIEQVASELNLAELGPAWQQQVMSFFQVHLVYLLKRGDHAKAFDLVQRSRVISFRFKAQMPQIHAWSEDLIALEKAHFFNGKDYSLALGTARLTAALAKLQNQSQSGGNSAPSVKTVSLDDLKKLLPDGQGVLLYYQTQQDYGVFWVRRGFHQVITLGAVSEIDTSNNGLYESLTSPMSNAWSGIQTASKQLISPMSGLSDIQTLLVYPEGSIYLVPFSALLLENGQPLIRSVKLIQPITVTLKTIEYLPENPPLRVSLFASPIFDNSLTTQLPSLPWSGVEASAITEVFGTQQVNAFVGRKANKTNLLSDMVRASPVLHISTHNHFDPKRPLLGGLSLAKPTSSSQTVADFVSFQEIFSYRFNNQLVFLNGCSTAMGQLHAGDGLHSVARGFLNSGANRVVGTLWPLADSASAKFSAEFYRHLKRHNDVAQALQQTQWFFASSGRYKHPFYWAGYSLFSQPDRNQP
ncbi:CHAT domain-containing protein [Alteromonas aestuariivivens]|uniref:CHAT domain-containing protein n=1 Tax=Alteromonas aestuariivivens TaxID=1938339 RepID=A0A3D8M385_9ALTE|nr:CHAT domain-containing protein [Alteromonas aestuariivivens]